MNNNKNKNVLILLAVVFVILMVVAVLSYDTLIAKMSPSDSPGGNSSSSINGNITNNNENKDISESVAAPDFILIDAKGNETRLSDYIGKPVVLNFWASWCPPCKMEMPYFDEIYSQVGEDAAILMVNAIGMRGETQKDAEKYVKSEGFSFPIFFDNNQEAATLYGLTSLPTTFFIDAQGNLVTHYSGSMSKEQLLEGISYIVE